MPDEEEAKDGRFVRWWTSAADITVGRVLGPVEGRKYGPEKAGWCRVSWSAVNTRVKRRSRGGTGGGGGLGKKREGHGRAARGSGEDVDKRGSHCPRRGWSRGHPRHPETTPCPGPTPRLY